MRITEQHLRQIIRETLDESAIIPVGVPAAQKMDRRVKLDILNAIKTIVRLYTVDGVGHATLSNIADRESSQPADVVRSVHSKMADAVERALADIDDDLVRRSVQ